MKIVGVIAEYNPFHNGHAYHLQAMQQSLQPDGVVVVMSGHFTQRGEPAIIDKWTRATMAVSSGADLVLEMPTLYACSQASSFAHAGVSLLSQLGIVTHLSFGSEAGDLEPLWHLAKLYEEDPLPFRLRAMALSKTGMAHPAAQAKALQEIFASEPETLSGANNVLAIEYLRSIQRLRSSLIPWTIKRQGAGYHDLALSSLASASAIRQVLLTSSDRSALQDCMPTSALRALDEQLSLGRGPVSWFSFDQTVLSLLRRTPIEQLAQLPEVNEGLEARIKEAADQPTLDDWLLKVKTRRYTRARLVRTLAHLILGITKNDMELSQHPIPYARVLAFNATGQRLLALARTKSQIPVILRAAVAQKQMTPRARRLLELDKLATDLWSTALPARWRQGGQDWTHPVVRLT